MHPCKSTDPNFSLCWRNTLQSLVPRLANGIPELDLPPTEPLSLPDFEFSLHTLYSNINMKVSNFTSTGAVNMTVKDANISLQYRIFKFKMYFPKITMNYIVDIQGNYRNIPLDNKIPANAEYGNERINIFFKLIAHSK